MRQDPDCERGEAALLAAAFAIIALAVLALPAYECGRMLTDKSLAAAAAADAACLLAAESATTTAELQGFLHDAYPHIAEVATVEFAVGDVESTDYDDKVFDAESGEYCSLSRTVASRQVTTRVLVNRPFVTNAAMFLSSAAGGSGSYSVSASGVSLIDETITSGGW